MKASKILISLLLLLALCVGLMSGTALAEGAIAAVDRGGSQEEMGSLEEAINAAEAGDRVVLLQSVTLSQGLVIDKDLTLDLSGKTLAFESGSAEDAAILVKNAEVTIRNGTLKVVEDEDAEYQVAVMAGKGSDVTLDNMKVLYDVPGGRMLATSGGSLTVYEGRYSQDPSAYLPSDYAAALVDGMFEVAPASESGEDASAETDAEPETEVEPAEGEDEETPGEGEEKKDPEEEGEEKKNPEDEEKKNPDEEKKDPEPAGYVSNADGSAVSTIYYYKQGSGMSGDKNFNVKPEPEKVVLYASDPGSATELAFKFTPTSAEDPAQGGKVLISESDNKATIEALPAGAYYLEFRFKGATAVKSDFYIFLSASLDTDKHVKGSGKPITVTITDEPDMVLISDNSNLSGGATLTAGSDYTYSGGTLTLTSSYLDTLAKDEEKVTKYVAFVVSYRGVNMAAPFQITILPPPSIDPTTVNWKRGTEKSFTVKPDIVNASIDGNAIEAKNFTAAGTKLTVKSGAVASLTWGEHTLTAETSSGPVSAKINIEPSLGWSSNTGNQHTKGGSKNIIFIASDPVSKVCVNGTEISSEHYSISDGRNITLKASYLNTLKADTTYTITVTVSNDGKTAEVSSNFKILSGGSGGSAGTAPQTGDSAPFLWMALLLASGCGFAVILPRLRKET